MKQKTIIQFHRPILFCVGLLLMIPPSLYSQQVVGTAGTVFENETMSISWTIGEAAIETLSAENSILTQGFHQPTLSVVSVEELVKHNFNIQAFPNPTRDFLMLQLDELPPKPLNYQIYNLSGQLMEQGSISHLQTQISFSSYKAAYYIIQINKESKPIKTFKISKTQ